MLQYSFIAEINQHTQKMILKSFFIFMLALLPNTNSLVVSKNDHENKIINLTAQIEDLQKKSSDETAFFQHNFKATQPFNRSSDLEEIKELQELSEKLMEYYETKMESQTSDEENDGQKMNEVDTKKLEEDSKVIQVRLMATEHASGDYEPSDHSGFLFLKDLDFDE